MADSDNSINIEIFSFFFFKGSRNPAFKRFLEIKINFYKQKIVVGFIQC